MNGNAPNETLRQYQQQQFSLFNCDRSICAKVVLKSTRIVLTSTNARDKYLCFLYVRTGRIQFQCRSWDEKNELIKTSLFSRRETLKCCCDGAIASARLDTIQFLFSIHFFLFILVGFVRYRCLHLPFVSFLAIQKRIETNSVWLNAAQLWCWIDGTIGVCSFIVVFRLLFSCYSSLRTFLHSFYCLFCVLDVKLWILDNNFNI